MIIDYIKNILLKLNNKFIFAPNSSGKSKFSDFFIKNIFKNQEFQIFKKENLKSIIKYKLKTFIPMYENKDKTFILKEKQEEYLNLEIEDRQFLKVTKNDIDYINLIKDLILKSKNFKFSLKNSQKLKKFISSSEYELTISMILIASFFNLEKNIILDDPIEFASWENEKFFVEFISYLLKKESKTRIIVFTHRFTLFSKFLEIHKEAIINKGAINSINPDYIYFMDDIPFWLNDLNPDFLTWIILKELHQKNIVFKRIYLEEIYKKQYFKSIGEDIDSQNLSNQQKEYVLDYEKATNEMKNNINFKISNDCSLDMSKFIDNKYNFINSLRNSILYDASKISKYKITKLKKVDISVIEKANAFKKDYDKNIIDHVKNTLNSFLHPSNWIIWNEIDANKLIFLIQSNFNFVKWPKTKEVIEIMSNYLEKKKNIVKEQSSSYKDNFLE